MPTEPRQERKARESSPGKGESGKSAPRPPAESSPSLNEPTYRAPLDSISSSRMSIEPGPPSMSILPPPPPPARLVLYEDVIALVEHFGEIGRMTAQCFVAMWRRPLEIQSTLYQMESLGVR